MNKTLPNPYYLFSFQHIASKERVSFYPQVITSNVRYDKFRFVEGVPTNLSLIPPKVTFPYLGQYYYSIYENITSGSTDINLAYNKLESGRAVVIVDDDQQQLCFYEPYISQNEEFANYIYISELEEECIGITPSPTPSITPTNTPNITPTITATATPTLTPTPSSTPQSYTGLTFSVVSGNTQNLACSALATGQTFTVYTNDLGNCGGCYSAGFTCWPCLNTTQTLYLDQALTIPVPTGYYANQYSISSSATWYTVNGLLQGAGFMSC